MKPSVGRSVHYTSFGTPGGEYGQECRAAVVTEVGEAWVPEGENAPAGTPVGLCVLNPTGQFFNQGVMEDQDAKRGGTWHWPERADEPTMVRFAEPDLSAAQVDELKAGLRKAIHQPGARPPRY